MSSGKVAAACERRTLGRGGVQGQQVLVVLHELGELVAGGAGGGPPALVPQHILHRHLLAVQDDLHHLETPRTQGSTTGRAGASSVGHSRGVTATDASLYACYMGLHQCYCKVAHRLLVRLMPGTGHRERTSAFFSA
jgi:hypothetical protein